MLARGVYSLIFALALPLILLRILWRSRRAPAYRERLSERFGAGAAVSGRPLWVHAVSVGETLAIAPLVERILAQAAPPQVLITTMTPTGAQMVQQRFGSRVIHRYCPWDLPGFWHLFMRRVTPRACVIVETELWPNMLAACKRADIPVLLANARLSARSARGYGRLPFLTRPMLRSLTCVAVQNRVDGDRFIELGLPSSCLEVTGSIKFDIHPPQSAEQEGLSLRQALGSERPVLLAASTHRGEDEILIQCWRRLSTRWPDLVLMIVPRHPERFSEVRSLLQAEAAGAAICCRSDGIAPTMETRLYLGDTLGELMTFYAAADIAFVGGSFSGTGGHNPLEPAALSKAVVMGPDTFNFDQITRMLIDAGGLVQVERPEQLDDVVGHWLEYPRERIKTGASGQSLVAANQGALDKLEQQVAALLSNQPR